MVESQVGFTVALLTCPSPCHLPGPGTAVIPGMLSGCCASLAVRQTPPGSKWILDDWASAGRVLGWGGDRAWASPPEAWMWRLFPQMQHRAALHTDFHSSASQRVTVPHSAKRTKQGFYGPAWEPNPHPMGKCVLHSKQKRPRKH